MSYQTLSLAYSVLVVTGAGTEGKKFCPSEEKELYFAQQQKLKTLPTRRVESKGQDASSASTVWFKVFHQSDRP